MFELINEPLDEWMDVLLDDRMDELLDELLDEWMDEMDKISRVRTRHWLQCKWMMNDIPRHYYISSSFKTNNDKYIRPTE